MAIKEKISVGIDIGSATIKIAVAKVSIENGKNISHIIGTGTSQTLGVNKGNIVDIPEVLLSLEEALNNAEKSSGKKITNAEISFGGTSLASIITNGQSVVGRADQEITSLDKEKADENARNCLPQSFTKNRKIFHTIPTLWKVDEEITNNPIGMKGNRLDTKNLFIACSERNALDLIRIFENRHIDINGITASPMAGSISVLSKNQKMASCVLVDIGYDTTTLVVYEDNRPVSIEVIPIGGNDVTKDIALGLKISLEDAESLKIGAVTRIEISKKKLDDIIEARLYDIFELVDNHLKKIGRSKMLPAGAIIIGGGAKTHGIENVARDCLKLPVKVGVVQSGNPGKTLDPSFAVAVGLCLIGAGNTDHTITNEPNHGITEIIIRLFKNLKKILP